MGVGFGDAPGHLDQTLPYWVLADGEQDLKYGPLYTRTVRGAPFGPF